jgi:hypothetical protein
MVLFLGGSGRSGSTMLERLLGQLPGVAPLGEVVHLWYRGLVKNEICACGEPFWSCPFWTEVGERAFGGWRNVDAREVLRLQAKVDRHRHLFKSLQHDPPARFRGALLTYASYYDRLYAAAKEITGAQVIVDSSKHGSTATVLSHDERLDLRMIQILRDPRGVAYSWAKSVTRPETTDEALMPRYSATTSTVFWMSQNLTMEALHRRGARIARMRYEDLVRNPRTEVASAWSALGLPGRGALPINDENVITLGKSHSVAGNPMRFKTGDIQLLPDAEWQQNLQRRDRMLITTLAYPLLVRYGYPRYDVP